MKWDGRYVAGVSKVSALKRTTEVGHPPRGRRPEHTAHVAERRGSSSRSRSSAASPTTPSSRRGRTWSTTSGDAAISLKKFRKDLIIELLNEQGEVAKAYKVYRCWVSEYQALPELDANANAVAIETWCSQNEGWERDVAVAEPTET